MIRAYRYNLGSTSLTAVHASSLRIRLGISTLIQQNALCKSSQIELSHAGVSCK